MSVELVVVIAAIVVSWLVFSWLIQVLKASLSTAIALAAILLILQLLFGISYQEIGQEIVKFPDTIWQLLKNK